MSNQDHDVKDLALAPEGVLRIEWADMHMPVLARPSASASSARSRWPGVRIGACLHVTTETANLMRTLKAGGADVVLCASNPLSTQDDVAAALVQGLRHPHLRHQGRGRRRPTTRTSTPPSTTAPTSPWTTAPT